MADPYFNPLPVPPPKLPKHRIDAPDTLPTQPSEPDWQAPVGLIVTTDDAKDTDDADDADADDDNAGDVAVDDAGADTAIDTGPRDDVAADVR